MLTIEDIRNPKRKSGFNHVTAAGGRSPQGGTVRGKPWCAVKRVKPGTGPGSFWKGPRRAAAEEAAQDYCDYINGQKVKMLTIEDIRNPKRKSGFNYVNYDHRSKKNPYRAQVGGSTSDPRYWRAEHWRPTAEAAAQDYCDHINGQQAATSAIRPTLKSAGHVGRRDRIERDAEVEAALGVLRDARGRRKGKQGFVYLIGELEKGQPTPYVKIGYSTKPDARPAELQTGNPRPLRVLASMPGTEGPNGTEGKLQQKYIQHNELGEWFEGCEDIFAEFGLSFVNYIKGVSLAA